MKYRIELERIDRRYMAYDKVEYVYSAKEILPFIREYVDEKYMVSKIIKTYKDGRGMDVTDKYI